MTVKPYPGLRIYFRYDTRPEAIMSLEIAHLTQYHVYFTNNNQIRHHRCNIDRAWRTQTGREIAWIA